MGYDVAAYIWPAYTGKEERTRIFWPEGIGEWQTVRDFTGNDPASSWPRRPLWGMRDEADPAVMADQIDQAVRHGVNVFIYDWYWFDRRPFLEQCLNEGFLGAPNHNKMKFYLMWANHNAGTLWDKRTSDMSTIIWLGGLDRPEFERAMGRVIDRYLSLDCYYRIDGKPVFMIYELPILIPGLGGADNTRRALDWMRESCVKAGLPGLHLQFTARGGQTAFWTEPDGRRVRIADLGFDSVTHYQFCHFANIDRSYPEVAQDAYAEWDRLDREMGIPYYPHVSVGWDTNPRFRTFRPGVMRDCEPRYIRDALMKAKAFLDERPGRAPLVTVNSWNEWTETSYLQPDDLYGYGYLDAVREVFGEA